LPVLRVSLAPLAACAIALKQGAGGLDVGVLGAPVGGEVAAEGGGEDGLAELVE
jgi:hypothetical protein